MGSGRAVWASLLLGALATGCSPVRETYDVPPIELPIEFREAAKAAQSQADLPDAAADPATVADRPTALPSTTSAWWRAFGNDELNRLVETAVTNSPTLRAAIARVAQAEAILARTGAAEYPELSTFAGLTHRMTQVRQGSREYNFGFEAQYEVDLWGKNRADTSSALERARASLHARETVAITLIADVVGTYLTYLSLNDRIRTARDASRIVTAIRDSVEERMQLGDATSFALARQRSEVAATAVVIPALELQRDEALHALALLLGMAPSQLELKGAGLSEVTMPGIDPGMPIDLLVRRPDISEAEARMLAADISIDVARANIFPSLDLGGRVGWGSRVAAMSTLLSPESLFYQAAATLSAVLFDAGRRRADIELARAQYEELVNNYAGRVFTALREVEDALSSIHYLSEQLAAQIEAEAAAAVAFEISTMSFEAGAVDYIELLDTERTWRQHQRSVYETQHQRVIATVGLFKALGGTLPPPAGEVLDQPRQR